MERINRIIKHKRYLEYIEKIKSYEQDRIFCKHDVTHFLEVCRIAEIDWLDYRIQKIENESKTIITNRVKESELMQVNREFIYAAGLLHDIGRWQEYESGIRHEIASSTLAHEILKECGFTENEIEKITFAISNHRNSEVKEDISLAGFIYRADKKSRPCYFCEVEKECNWSVLKKNLMIS